MERPHVYRKTGSEQLTFDGRPIGHALLDFWRWSVSDLVSNATRGRFAEFVVGSAIGVDFSRVREEWQAWDLTTAAGLRIEVKSAAYVQSWHQKKHSSISFSIKASQYWDAETNMISEQVGRFSDLYVFCILSHLDPATIDPLRMEQWEFHVVATSLIDGYQRSQHSITLPSLKKLVERDPDRAAGPLRHGELAAAVSRIGRTASARRLAERPPGARAATP